MRLLDRGFGLVFFGLALLLTGCSGARLLMPTPNVHLDAERDFYSDLSRELKSTEVPLFYTTDRAPERDEQGNLRYGYERSPSLGFGTAVVDLGVDITGYFRISQRQILLRRHAGREIKGQVLFRALWVMSTLTTW